MRKTITLTAALIVTAGLLLYFVVSRGADNDSSEIWTAFYYFDTSAQIPTATKTGYANIDECKQHLLDLNSDETFKQIARQHAEALSGFDNNSEPNPVMKCGFDCSDKLNRAPEYTCEELHEL